MAVGLVATMTRVPMNVLNARCSMLAKNEVSKASTSPRFASAISTEWMTRRVSFWVSVTGTRVHEGRRRRFGRRRPADGSTTTLRRPCPERPRRPGGRHRVPPVAALRLLRPATTTRFVAGVRRTGSAAASAMVVSAFGRARVQWWFRFGRRCCSGASCDSAIPAAVGLGSGASTSRAVIHGLKS